jgi:cardiolipin synthase A/B
MQLSALRKKYLSVKRREIHSYSNKNNVIFLKSGDEFFNELENQIIHAKYVIHLQTYIFDSDEVGLKIIDLLIKKAKEGVKIFLFLDGYGSSNISKLDIKRITDARIYFKKYAPFHASFKFIVGRRLHHKILLVDGETALVGGINIAQKYKGSSREKPWLDFAVKVEGEICKDILKICEGVLGRKLKKKIKSQDLHILNEGKKGTIEAKILQNDWVKQRVEISAFYRQNIRQAQHSLIIVASYFLPGMRIRKLLKKAAQRGVKITMILPGKSDVGFMKQATYFLYPFLLRHKIEILEWQPSVMHGKLMIVDDEITTIGSYNLNSLSDYGSLELNVCVKNSEFAKTVHQQISILTKECKQILSVDFSKQHYWWNQTINWISYQLLRNSLKLFFYFMRK